MRYVTLEARKLPIGSGQVESAVRRVVNLRFKAPGSFWREMTVSGLMHLRAAFKAGRWDEIMFGVITDTFQVPSFEPVDNAVLSAIDSDPGRRDAPNVRGTPKEGRISCPLFTNSPGNKPYNAVELMLRRRSPIGYRFIAVLNAIRFNVGSKDAGLFLMS